MVLTTKQTKANAPAAPSRSSSSTVASKATKRASLNVKPATSVPSPALKETYVDRTGSNGLPEPRNPSSILTGNAKHDPSGPFADNPKFLSSPKKTAAAKKVRARTVKRQSKVYRKRRTTEHLSDIVTLLTKIAFLLFSIYSLLVCPKDVEMESPVCRGLDRYRKSIVDPYILPPLRAAASHPAIAPRIEQARPYVDHAVEVVKTRYHIVHDQVVVATEPYMILARKQYNAKARPQVRLMQYNMRRYQRQAQPYVDLAKAKALQAWYQAEVYVLPILLKLEQTPMLLKTFIAKPLEEGKERWVDPQLKKIVDKVHEMSASAAVVAEEKVVPDGTSATTEKATYYSSPSVAASVSITEATSTTIEEAPAPTVPEPVPEESAQTGIVEAQPTLSTLTSGTATSESTSETASAESTIDPLDMPLINPNYDEDVEDTEIFEDLEKWVAEALVVEQATTPMEMPPKPTHLTEEEKAEKKRILNEETAAKRKDIMARHDRWEIELEELYTNQYNNLREYLEQNRQQEFSKLSDSKSLAHSQLSVLNSQLEAAIKGTKQTLAKMQANWEDRYRGVDEDVVDKLPRWAQILENIEWSFTRKSEKLNEDLGKWIAEWTERESAALKETTGVIEAFANKAQNDLLADYAWLNDVTYRDWERYHRLMFRHREIAEELQKLFNGHTSPPVNNPVQDEITLIEDQLYEVTLNFKAGVDKIRKEGWKYLLGDIDENAKPEPEDQEHKAAETTPEEPTFSILPIDLEGKIDNIIQGGGAILSKSKEQVEQAVLMAEEAATEAGKKVKEAVVGHEEL